MALGMVCLCLTMPCLRSQNHKRPNHQTTKPPNHQTTKPPNHKTTKRPNHRSNLAGVESIWLKQGRKLVGLSPEVAWPLMDSTGAGTFSCPEMASGGVQAEPVLDGSECLLKAKDQGSVSDSATKDWDAGADCDTDEAHKLLHMAVAMAKALEDEHQILRVYTARLYSMGWLPSRSSREEQNAK